MSSLKKLFVHFGHFFGAGVLSLLLGLLTFPILTRLLTREDYGILGLVTTTMLIVVAFSKGGLSDGIIRFYREYTDTRERLTLFTSTVLTRGVILSIIVVVIYLVALPHINHYLGIKEKYAACFTVMALYLLVRPLNIIVLNYLRATGKTFRYNVVNLSTRVISILLSLTLLIYIVRELYGYFLGVALAEVFGTVMLYRWFLSNYPVSIKKVSPDLTLNLVKFGIPLLVTELLYLLLSYADRYMIVAINGEDMLGLYSVGYNLAAYINDLVMFSLSYAVVPMYTEIYATSGREQTEEFLRRCMNYYLIGVIPMCAGYAAVSRDLVITLASAKYSDSAVFSPLILVGLVFLGMNTILYAGLYLQKKTLQILAIMLTAVTVNVVLNLILLPTYGAMGAAVATLIACVCSTAMTIPLAFKYIRVRINAYTIIYYVLISTIMYGILMQLETGKVWLNLIAKIAVGAIIIAVSVILREREIRVQAKNLYVALRK